MSRCVVREVRDDIVQLGFCGRSTLGAGSRFEEQKLSWAGSGQTWDTSVERTQVEVRVKCAMLNVIGDVVLSRPSMLG